MGKNYYFTDNVGKKIFFKSKKELADYLKISVSTLYKHIASNDSKYGSFEKVDAENISKKSEYLIFGEEPEIVDKPEITDQPIIIDHSEKSEDEDIDKMYEILVELDNKEHDKENIDKVKITKEEMKEIVEPYSHDISLHHEKDLTDENFGYYPESSDGYDADIDEDDIEEPYGPKVSLAFDNISKQTFMKTTLYHLFLAASKINKKEIEKLNEDIAVHDDFIFYYLKLLETHMK